MVVLQNIVSKKLTLISFLHFQKKSTAFKVLFKLQKFFFVRFAEHLEKPLILQKNHMAWSQTYTSRQ